LHSPGLQKVSKNKNVGRQYVRDKTVLITQTNCIIKAVEDEKIMKMVRKTTDIMVAVTADV
jgi:hypothetical protein